MNLLFNAIFEPINSAHFHHQLLYEIYAKIMSSNARLRGEWPSGLYSLRQVTEVKLGRVRSDFGWVTTEA